MFLEIAAPQASTPDTFSDALATYKLGLDQVDGQIYYAFDNNNLTRANRLQAFKSLYITMAATIFHHEDAKARASTLRTAAQAACAVSD